MNPGPEDVRGTQAVTPDDAVQSSHGLKSKLPLAMLSAATACVVLAACGGSSSGHGSDQTAAKKASHHAPAAPTVSSNAYLQDINTQCAAAKPTVLAALRSANAVAAGSASSASSVVPQAAQEVMALNTSSQSDITNFDAQEGSTGTQSPGNWHVQIEVLYGQLMLFANPQTGPTSPQAAATNLISEAQKVSALATASQMPACSLASVVGSGGQVSDTDSSGAGDSSSNSSAGDQPATITPSAPTTQGNTSTATAPKWGKGLTPMSASASAAALAAANVPNAQCLAVAVADADHSYALAESLSTSACQNLPAGPPPDYVLQEQGGTWKNIWDGTDGCPSSAPNAVIEEMFDIPVSECASA